jgi:hypothetical protein
MTRDSLWFSWLAVIGGLAGYLATGPSPLTWDWPHWMQAVVVLTGLIAAKLGTSPLPSQLEKALNK